MIHEAVNHSQYYIYYQYSISAESHYNHLSSVRQPGSFRNNSSSRSSSAALADAGPLNYCTIRRPTGNSNTNQQRRAVQFADQQESRSGGQEDTVIN